MCVTTFLGTAMDHVTGILSRITLAAAEADMALAAQGEVLAAALAHLPAACAAYGGIALWHAVKAAMALAAKNRSGAAGALIECIAYLVLVLFH